MIRNPVPWPGGAKVACAITFDMDADSLVHIEHPKDSIKRVSTISMLRYGPQVGVPRILETYRRYGLRQTFFVPAWCIEQYPQAVEGMVKDGHEVGFHGYIHEAPNSLARTRSTIGCSARSPSSKSTPASGRAATARRSTISQSTRQTCWSRKAFCMIHR